MVSRSLVHTHHGVSPFNLQGAWSGLILKGPWITLGSTLVEIQLFHVSSQFGPSMEWPRQRIRLDLQTVMSIGATATSYRLFSATCHVTTFPLATVHKGANKLED